MLNQKDTLSMCTETMLFCVAEILQMKDFYQSQHTVLIQNLLKSKQIHLMIPQEQLRSSKQYEMKVDLK